MILDATLRLEAVLAGAVAANQPESHVNFQDWTSPDQGQPVPSKPAPYRVALNSTTDVTILAMPNQGVVRDVIRISIYNKDTATVTVTVKTDDGTTEFIAVKQALLTGETLVFERGAGWQII